MNRGIPNDSPEPSPGASSHAPLSEATYHILLALFSQDLHGYALILDVERRTDGEVRLTASTLYAALRRLLESGWLDEVPSPDHDGDSRRRTYRLTDAGRAALEREARRLERQVELARQSRVLPELSTGESP